MTRARLTARADQLAAELTEFTSGSPSISCEQPLSDPRHRLRGIPDVTIHGSRSAIVDFKTGRDAKVPLTDRIRLQLLIYAHFTDLRTVGCLTSSRPSASFTGRSEYPRTASQ